MPLRFSSLARLAALALSLPLAVANASAAADAAPFRFESVRSIDAMQDLVRATFPQGAPRAGLRRAFVEEGGASLREHPSRAGTEKYLYDINLCRVYVWRWNVSADYDADGRLVQAWVNGEPVHAAGPQRTDPAALPHGPRAAVLRVVRPRPEASLGEKELVYLAFDLDGNPATTADRIATGGGPSQPNPANMGRMHVYANVDPWRSIFDADAADRIVEYAGMCPPARQER
ncbi:hypothetical protein [uncultured Massilia sp.]|uniref:hypothetical protein n=1 Tax=uncultured Massilia sp. TaxID=169973 RepID=UPI0025E8FEC0|nr:hypothetical protein [uncultured Massilia sp.]